jgi:hypothetical protein
LFAVLDSAVVAGGASFFFLLTCHSLPQEAV